MISLKTISSVATNKKTYERGFEYYNQRRVSNLVSETNPLDGHTHISAEVLGSKYSYEVEVTLDAEGKLVYHFCDCPAFYSYEGCCKHIVAVLLQYYYRMVTEDHAPVRLKGGTVTDSAARQMIKQYSDRMINSAVSNASVQKVRLIPVVKIDSFGRLALELTVGNERMYIIKDLPKFYSDITSGNVVEYGVKLKFLHNENAFDEQSRPLLRFFTDKFRELLTYVNLQAMYKNDKRSLYLSPRAFDDFFNIYEGQRVAFNFDVDKSQVLFANENPPLELTLNKEGNAFKLKMGLPDLLVAGAKCQYMLIGDRLLRCSEACTQATSGLLQAMMGKDGTLVVAEADMGEFCSSVVSEIRPYVNIKADDEDIASFLPMPLVSKLYLDMPSVGLITGNLKFCYGDNETDAMSEAKMNFQRNIKEELLAQSFVKKYFEAYDPEQRFLYIQDDDRIYRLLSEGIDEMSGTVEIYTTDKFKSVAVRRPPQVSVGVRLRSNLIDIDIDTDDFPPEELAALLGSYRQHKKYHKLRDGSFVGLENSPLADISQLAQGLDLTDDDFARGGATVPKYRALYLDGIIKDSAQLKTERDIGFKAMVRDINDISDSETEPPESLRHILRNYQKTGFRWLKTMSRYGFGGVLADDMGLGKTLEAIAFLLSNKEENPEKCVSLIVCPASLVLNWESEINHFAPQLKALSVIGDAQQRAEFISHIHEYDAIITSYDLLKRDIELYKEIKFFCQIIDEAQYIKNAVTQNARAVKSVQSEQRFALTGTPIENSLAEIWSIFDFLMPGYLHNHNRFKQDFELPVIKNNDENALINLKKLLSPFILRRLKANVLKELPPKTETVLYAALDGEQKRLYTANLAKIRSQLGSQFKSGGLSGSRVVILAMLTRLRQLCCDPTLCYEDYHSESAKLELCLELLESSVQAGHKVLLFSQFTSMLSIIEAHLKQLAISYYVLKGSTPKEERAALTSRFNIDDTKVFLISLKAGGTGLNLTGADIVIHYDPWWNISAQNQATDRAHRIGQQNSVQVYKLIAKDTIEEKILKLQKDKMKLADSVISEGDGMISRMSSDEILNLFEG
jgi:superfamily II DNA or RNA helicase